MIFIEHDAMRFEPRLVWSVRNVKHVKLHRTTISGEVPAPGSVWCFEDRFPAMASHVGPSSNIGSDYSQHGNYIHLGQHATVINISSALRSRPLGMVGFRPIYR